MTDTAPNTATAQQLDAEQARKHAAISKRLEVSLGQFVVLMMRSPHYRHHTLGDLEWLVTPPVLAGQFAIAEAQSKDNGFTAPVAAVTWARVSPEVTAKLTASIEKPFRLRPDEWKSGDYIWVIDAHGDAKVITSMLQRMAENEWKGQQVRVRIAGKDGKPEIKLFTGGAAAA
ncbi:MAG: toxin-activating lysine-acyltransferase [Hyphomicrobium sp.]|nr:toxin-activating lysine-acyltransferase [Hyphomicrobium sp.]